MTRASVVQQPEPSLLQVLHRISDASYALKNLLQVQGGHLGTGRLASRSHSSKLAICHSHKTTEYIVKWLTIIIYLQQNSIRSSVFRIPAELPQTDKQWKTVPSLFEGRYWREAGVYRRFFGQLCSRMYHFWENESGRKGDAQLFKTKIPKHLGLESQNGSPKPHDFCKSDHPFQTTIFFY